MRNMFVMIFQRDIRVFLTFSCQATQSVFISFVIYLDYSLDDMTIKRKPEMVADT